MPVQNEIKYDITFKNLRHRQIPFTVIAVPQKNEVSHSENQPKNSSQSQSKGQSSQAKTRKKIIKTLKQRLNRMSTTPKRNSKSSLCLDRKSEVTSKVVKKRVYRKKGLQTETPPQKEITKDILNSTSDANKDALVATPETKETTKDNLNSTSDINKDALVATQETMKDNLNSTSDINKDALVAIQETKETNKDNLNSTSNINKDALVAAQETLKKRTIKIPVGATITPITSQTVSVSTAQSNFGIPVITPETPKKRVYRKRLKIPAVPHNTPVFGRTSVTNSSILNQSTISHSEVITIGKRGRGRPRMSLLAVGHGSDTGEETSMSQSSDKGSTTRRVRKSLWGYDSDVEDEVEAKVSEYELLRQRNIEENLKKLREIFTEQGLQFEDKSSETPKKRKRYSRIPLPPPRPRSQRIEGRTSLPIDFSELDKKLAMSQSAFM